MRFLLDRGDGAEVERVARVGLEGADAAFAEENVGIAVRQDVLGRQQPFLDLHAEAALEQDRLAAAGRLGDEGEILRIAGADLEDVGMLPPRDRRRARKALRSRCRDRIPFCRLGEKAQAFLGETLEFIRRRAGLVRAAAQEGRALGLDRLGGGHELLLAFHRAGARP